MRQKILIVEDELIVATDLQQLLESAGFFVCPIAQSYREALALISESRPDLVIVDIILKGKLTGIDLARNLREENIAFIYLSSNATEDMINAAKTTNPYGFLVKPWRERDILATIEIARFRHEHSRDSQDRKKAIFRTRFAEVLKENRGWKDSFIEIFKAMQGIIPFDLIGIEFRAIGLPVTDVFYSLRLGFDEYQFLELPELIRVTKVKDTDLEKLRENDAVDTIPAIYDEDKLQKTRPRNSFRKLIKETFQMRSLLVLPLPLSNGEVFYFLLYNRKVDTYFIEHILMFSRLQRLLFDGVETLRKNELRNSKSYRPVTARKGTSPGEFFGIIGKSHLMLTVFDLITQVAPMDTSVLILGESGTGKERIADAIYQLSSRKNRPFVKINCASLPPTLIESELFGHEKGAFTGATEKRFGKFEQAHTGTIFLDEVGELPIELQGKLLRVLQEKEIERIGGRSPVKLDVRVIAATNRNLEKEVAEGRFRLDLYFRLNVFPIGLPALRDKKDDLPGLVDFFIKHFNKKMNKRIVGLSFNAMKSLEGYHWPGNIRELEHVIEREILISKTDVIDQVTLPAWLDVGTGNARLKTIEENERDHIISALKRCKGKIWGAGGAAEVLNVPPTTLNSKIKKLGISRLA